jgi:bifunctional non-homologous end joining protein LigD
VRRAEADRTHPRESGNATGGGEPTFVVHRHRARTEHYDFRLEVGGVLKSWVVPKGPSMDPREKRLAIPVEEEYAAGDVIVWDSGTYRNRTKRDGREVPVEHAVAQGHVVVDLHGRRLRGGFALTRTGVDGRGRERWLLVKKRDAYAVEEVAGGCS